MFRIDEYNAAFPLSFLPSDSIEPTSLSSLITQLLIFSSNSNTFTTSAVYRILLPYNQFHNISLKSPLTILNMQPTALVSTLLLLLPLASSHFTLQSPEVRGFDEDKLGNFPCGGQDFNGKRTPWPLTGGPIQLNMEHDRSAVQVLLGLGNDVGDNFNIILQPTLQEQGIGDFCLDNVVRGSFSQEGGSIRN